MKKPAYLDNVFAHSGGHCETCTGKSLITNLNITARIIMDENKWNCVADDNFYNRMLLRGENKELHLEAAKSIKINDSLKINGALKNNLNNVPSLVERYDPMLKK